MSLLKPERPSDSWTEVQVTKDQRAYKLFINRDQNEQQQRLQLVQRKIRDACKELYPTVAVDIPKP
eukprot:4600463-Karenia_brevis.AAC.1